MHYKPLHTKNTIKLNTKILITVVVIFFSLQNVEVIASPADSATIDKHINSGEYDLAATESLKHKNHYLSELIRLSKELDLANKSVWRVLVLYEKNFFSGDESQVDGPDFFLSKEGKTNPQKELEATLASFFSNKQQEHVPFIPKCRFVARFHWLQKKLNIDESRLPSKTCTKYQKFYDTVKPNAISVIFPSANPKGPSSMFGHTLLRIDRINQTNSSRMLAFSINFAAMIDPNLDAMSYAVAGLGGGFPGQYTILPYYMKLREYAQLENRDIWEYRLKLSQDEIDFILMHAYELIPTYFEYYFFTENCSYHLLSLIDAAFADEKLTTQFNSWTIPIDTIKVLEDRGLIDSVSYQPSHRRIIETKQRKLSDADQDIAFTLFKTNDDAIYEEISQFDKHRQAAILDYTYDLLRYEKLSKLDLMDNKLNAREKNILKRRSQLKVRSNKIEPAKPETRPDQGHGSARMSMNIGQEDTDIYADISWRSAYHDLTDPVSGYMFGYGLSFFDINLRYNYDSQQAELNKITLIDLTALVPRDKTFPDFSWHIESNLQQLPRTLFSDRVIFDVTGGGGVSYQFKTENSNLTYLLVDASLAGSKAFVDEYSIGIGVTTGTLISLTNQWIAQLQLKSIKSLWGDETLRYNAEFNQSFSTSQNTAIKLKLSHSKFKSLDWEKYEASFHYYF